MKRLILSFLLVLSVGSGARAQGVIIGPDARMADLQLRSHRVDADVQERVAVVTVEHEFVNPGHATVEGTFLFPLPADAQVSDFSMEVDGKEMAGELLDAEEARRIYEDIVRRSLDPALLEMADYRTFRARVFPIPGGKARKITIRYDLTLPVEGTMVSFLYPLQGHLGTRHAAVPLPEWPVIPRHDGTPGAREEVHGRSLIRVNIQTATGLKNIYSPSHEVDLEREAGRRAVVTYENNDGLDGRDFVLYYSLDPSDIGATLLTHRPYRDRPGYFMLLFEPPFDFDVSQVRRKDVVFVLDTSGSMAGEKITQARDALRYCLRSLNEQDRFGVIAFSSDVDVFRDALSPASSRDDALYFVDQLEARGGTNINEALLAAVSLLEGSEDGLVVFLTDGLPSTGVTEEGQIRKNVSAAHDGDLRVFSFGVGYDVNTRLLDGLSRESNAFADYISPEENIEERVSAFYDKIRYPVLTDVAFELGGVDAFAYAPRELPNLYKGGQLILAGRYRGAGDARLTLRGRIGGRPTQRTYALRFPELERERDFVARLWATRRVGLLLDDVRMRGENPELKEEIIALAKEFGLVTPYTSYLVQEEEAIAGRQGLFDSAFRREAGAVHAPAPAAEVLMTATTGADAVQMSKSIQQMQQAETAPSATPAGTATVNGRTLRREADGAWIDVEFDASRDRPVEIEFASNAYFALLREYPDVLGFARLGDRVTFRLGERYIRIGDRGEEHADAARLRALLD